MTLVEVVEDKQGKDEDAYKALGCSCGHDIVFGTCPNNLFSLGCLHPVQVSPEWKVEEIFRTDMDFLTTALLRGDYLEQI